MCRCRSCLSCSSFPPPGPCRVRSHASGCLPARVWQPRKLSGLGDGDFVRGSDGGGGVDDCVCCQRRSPGVPARRAGRCAGRCGAVGAFLLSRIRALRCLSVIPLPRRPQPAQLPFTELPPVRLLAHSQRAGSVARFCPGQRDACDVRSLGGITAVNRCVRSLFCCVISLVWWLVVH